MNSRRTYWVRTHTHASSIISTTCTYCHAVPDVFVCDEVCRLLVVALKGTESHVLCAASSRLQLQGCCRCSLQDPVICRQLPHGFCTRCESELVSRVLSHVCVHVFVGCWGSFLTSSTSGQQYGIVPVSFLMAANPGQWRLR